MRVNKKAEGEDCWKDKVHVQTKGEKKLCVCVLCVQGARQLLLTRFIVMSIFFSFVFPQWLPESARYYVASGNQEKAHAILKQVALCNNKPMPLGRLKIEDSVVSNVGTGHCNNKKTYQEDSVVSNKGLVIVTKKKQTNKKQKQKKTYNLAGWK